MRSSPPENPAVVTLRVRMGSRSMPIRVGDETTPQPASRNRRACACALLGSCGDEHQRLPDESLLRRPRRLHHLLRTPGTQAGLSRPRRGTAGARRGRAAGVRIGLTSAAAANRYVGLGVATSVCVATEIVLWVADVDGMHEAALAAGATEVVAPVDSPDDRLHYSWVRDPDGHQVKFVQKR